MSVIGVALGTMALVIVLSVFNGLEDLIKSIYGSFDPDIKITAVSGKSFLYDSKLISQIKNLPSVAYAVETIEDNVLVKYADKQTIVKLKGVSGEFAEQYRLKNYITEGKGSFRDNAGISYAIIGRGVQYKMGIDMENRFFQLQCWYPKTEKKTLNNPENSFNSSNIYPGGIFALEKQYDDNYIFVPIDFAKNLMGYENKLTSLEIMLKENENPNKLKSEIEKIVGNNYLVQTSDEQHVSMLRAVKIEKLFVYITFSFILAISSLNIFFTLTMLAIEKKHDVGILYSMGATAQMVKNVFLLEGIIIAGVGAMSGLLMGYGICWLQQEYGLVSMGAETSLVSAYPVKMRLSDFLISGIIIFMIAIFISYPPANKARKNQFGLSEA
jgi:lipoprotein-releasing system permease protein